MATVTPEEMAGKLLAEGFSRSGPAAQVLSDPLTDTPMVVTLDDLRPSVRLAHELVNAGVQARNLAFVLCRTGDSDKEIASARQYIEGAGYRCLEAPWPERTGYRDSHDQGKAGSEALHPSLRTKAEAVAKAVVDFIGED